MNPNEAKVLTLFGRYVGSVKTPGIWWIDPFMVKKKVSLRVRNFETSELKVNDSHSNPIELAAVVLWKVRRNGGGGSSPARSCRPEEDRGNGERRAAMVSNLLVVLCCERGTTPVLNAGSLYQ